MKNDTGYGILEKEVRDIRIRKKFVRDIGIEIPCLSPPYKETRHTYFVHWDK